jgi:glutathione peroxidase
MRTSLLLAALAGVATLAVAIPTAAARDADANAFDYEFEAIGGGRLPLDKWRGKVLLVANTASFCGFTQQYEGLQALWQRFEKRGLIASFCQGAFGVTFPLTAKEAVSGPNAHPFYRWAREAVGAANAPRWNFHKYLIGRNGKIIAGYGSSIEPLSLELINAIEAALGPAS